MRPIFGINPGAVDTPEWVKHAVFYQIFPDRFAKSDRTVKPSGLESWESDPTTYGYKGGDLLGVAENLDYLIDLGITAIYLNPIFQSASNHRYHTHDYFQVDPLLGGSDAFAELLAVCKEREIRVVLDGVFNHCSRGFFQFNDVLENGQASPWLDWFTIRRFPTNAYDHNKPADYEAWYKLHALPKFNTDNPQVREFIMQVGEHWTRLGIDGWRLDVPHEISAPGFWQEFRQRVRAINPDCWICGEIWHDSRPWLRGDQFDAVMNYVFTEAVLAFSGRDRVVRKLQEDRGYNPWPGIDASAYAGKIDTLLASYDWNVTTAQMNLLDSHDTARALTLMGGDRRSLELAALLMFTFPGAPTIYYGDEIGLAGGLPDRWARKSFPWDGLSWDVELRQFYQHLIRLRARFRALRTGSYRALAVGSGAYGFVRGGPTEHILIVINTGDEAEDLPIDGHHPTLNHLAVGEPVTIRTTGMGSQFTVPARSAAILSVRDA